MLNIFFPRNSFCLWDNVRKYCRVKQATDDDITRCKKNAICLPTDWGKNTGWLAYYLILIAFPRQQFLRKSASMWRFCARCLSCVLSTGWRTNSKEWKISTANWNKLLTGLLKTLFSFLLGCHRGHREIHLRFIAKWFMNRNLQYCKLNGILVSAVEFSLILVVTAEGGSWSL